MEVQTAKWRQASEEKNHCTHSMSHRLGLVVTEQKMWAILEETVFKADRCIIIKGGSDSLMDWADPPVTRTYTHTHTHTHVHAHVCTPPPTHNTGVAGKCTSGLKHLAVICGAASGTHKPLRLPLFSCP